MALSEFATQGRESKNVRGENISRIVTGFALTEYKFKQLVTVQPSSAWTETYFAETAADLTGGTGTAVKGVPRLAAFPSKSVTWTKKQGQMIKHGMEDTISFEEARTNEIDVMQRTMLRIARAVTKSVDTEIWNVLTENQSAVDINTVATETTWNNGTPANIKCIDDIMDAKRLIAQNDYNPDKNGFLLLSPLDFKSLVTWLIETKGANIPQFSSEKVVNGRIGEFLGLTVVVSNNVTADYAAVIIGKECGVYKQAVPLTVRTIEEPGRYFTIRAWEMGVVQLTNPKAVCLITNTQE